MYKTELFFVEAESPLGKLVDAEPIITASQQENMLPLSPGDLETHSIGIFLTAGLGKDRPALGYVACKNIFEVGFTVQPHEVASVELGQWALIGGLYLDPAYRGRGLARRLVGRVTDKVFAKYPEVSVCMSYCNANCASVFQASNYHAVGEERQCKTPYALNRAYWERVKFVNMS